MFLHYEYLIKLTHTAYLQDFEKGPCFLNILIRISMWILLLHMIKRDKKTSEILQVFKIVRKPSVQLQWRGGSTPRDGVGILRLVEPDKACCRDKVCALWIQRTKKTHPVNLH